MYGDCRHPRRNVVGASVRRLRPIGAVSLHLTWHDISRTTGPPLPCDSIITTGAGGRFGNGQCQYQAAGPDTQKRPRGAGSGEGLKAATVDVVMMVAIGLVEDRGLVAIVASGAIYVDQYVDQSIEPLKSGG